MVRYASNFTTHIELVILRREFHPHKTYLWSLSLKTLSRHRKYLCDSLLTTPMPTENAHRKRRRVRILSWGPFTSQNISSVIRHIESLDACMEY
jgi:hypothetical protein